MELIIAGVAIIIVLLFLRKVDMWISPKDTREPYFRNEDGAVMAVKIQGQQGSLPSHEEFMHNGLPHQNPLVQIRQVVNFWKFWSPIYNEETRYYPITINYNLQMDRLINELQNNIIKMRDERVNLVPLTEREAKEVYAIETQGQQAKGVEYLRPLKDT